MNKTYIKPQMIIVEVEAEALMQASMDFKEEVVDSQLGKGHNSSFQNFDVWGADEDEE